MTVQTKPQARLRRRRRVRAKISGTAERPRISVFRSNRGVFAQLIDDSSGRTLAAVIRKQRPPEPYKGKGIRYEGEYVARKVGKRA